MLVLGPCSVCNCHSSALKTCGAGLGSWAAGLGSWAAGQLGWGAHKSVQQLGPTVCPTRPINMALSWPGRGAGSQTCSYSVLSASGLF